jgi:hypothetical protein
MSNAMLTDSLCKTTSIVSYMLWPILHVLKVFILPLLASVFSVLIDTPIYLLASVAFRIIFFFYLIDLVTYWICASIKITFRISAILRISTTEWTSFVYTIFPNMSVNMTSHIPFLISFNKSTTLCGLNFAYLA